MKNIFRLSIYLFIAACFGMLTVSCEDDSDEPVSIGISQMNITSAYPLEEVTIQGTNLNSVQYAFIGQIQAPMVLNDDNTLTITVPQTAASGASTIILAAPGGARASAEFEVLVRPEPIIKAITPTAAASGEQVTILGTSLNNIESVTVGGVGATVDASSTADRLVITVPAGLPANIPAIIEITTNGGKTSSESIFYVGENLIPNGNFEQGSGDDFASWTKANNSHNGLSLADASNSYAGRTLRAVAATTQQWVPQMFSAPVTTNVGDEYTLTMWIKGAAGNAENGGRMRFSTTPSAMYSGNYAVTTEWQQIQWVFTANAPETQVVLDLGGVPNAVYFIDNVTLVHTGQAAPQPVELMLNGGFEAGAGDDFTNWSKNNAANLLTATTTAANVRNGSRALRAQGFGQDHWRTQFASDVMQTVPGEQYTASFWIKPQPGPGVGGIVRMSTAGNGTAQYQGDVTVAGTEWQKVEWTFTANSTETRIVLDLGKTLDAVYFIDDASFLDLPE